ncbi:MAG: hypothetical protein ABR577_07870 [Pyrinomonadaceae bacterium]
MAEERNLATARAADTGSDEDSTKAELQRRMEEARESITQTVTEIKDTVTNQYQSVKDSVNEALDWREQVRRRPVAWSVGALTAGVLVGYGLGAALMGGRSSYETDYRAYDEEDDSDDDSRSYATRYSAYEGGRNAYSGGNRSASSTRSYAAQGITGGGAYSPSSSSSSVYGRDDEASDYRPSYSSGYTATPEEDESQKPGLIEKFKGTQAFDRLQSEVSALGDRFIDEISSVGQNVVLPALMSKVKELFGVDLSNKAGSASPQRTATGASSSAAAASGNATQGADGSSTGSSADRQSGGYGTSENRGYDVASRDRAEYERGSSSRDRDDYGRSGSTQGRDRY